MKTELKNLLNIPDEERDIEWEKKFLDLIPDIKIKLITDTPQMGPDRFPYLLAETADDAKEPIEKVIKWLSDKGIGLVLNPNQKFPDYIFSYGMLWNYVTTGRFRTGMMLATNPDIEIEAGSKFYVGTPSDTYLPQKVRAILREYLHDQGVMKPKIIMISKNNIDFDLCFSQESFGNPEINEHRGILEAISWFLPTHYSVAFISEQNLPEFQDL